MDTSIGRLATRGRPESRDDQRAARPPGHRMGNRLCHAVPAVGRKRLHHRTDAGSRWRSEWPLRSASARHRTSPASSISAMAAFAYLQPDGGWGFSNTGLVTDGGEALLIDTMFDTQHTQAMLDGFARTTKAKIGTLVQHASQRRSLLRQCAVCEAPRSWRPSAPRRR